MDHATKTPRGIVYRTKPCCMGPLYFMHTPFSPDGHVWAECRRGSPNPWILGYLANMPRHKVKGSPGTRFGPIVYSPRGFLHQYPRFIIYDE